MILCLVNTYHPGILCASFSASVLPVGGVAVSMIYIVPNQPQRGSLPVILEAIRVGVGLGLGMIDMSLHESVVWDRHM